MKIYILIISLLCSIELVFGMALHIPNAILSIQDSINLTKNIVDSTAASQLNDSCGVKRTVDSTTKVFREIRVKITPEEAGDASITIIRKSRIDIYPSYTAVVTGATPDTLGIWKAPLSICLSIGIYDVIANREGFKKAVKKIEINKKQKYDILLDMTSLEYLRSKHEQWATYKWISAAVVIGSGATTLYFKNRINKYTDEYNNAMLSDDIRDSRNRIHTNQSNYKTFSIAAFSALGCFAVTWFVESLYNR